MQYPELSQPLIDLQNEDLALREQLVQSGQLSNGYNEAMQALHNKNAQILDQIIDTIGYPTPEKVGQEASQAAWLVIQHAIGQPAFMKKCLLLLEREIAEKNADPVQAAYLADRIAVLAGNPQHYGTQFDWDEQGLLSPQPLDDWDEVNARRKALGLNTLEEQTIVIRKQAALENQTPPADFAKRQQAMEDWKKAVGWV